MKRFLPCSSLLTIVTRTGAVCNTGDRRLTTDSRVWSPLAPDPPGPKARTEGQIFCDKCEASPFQGGRRLVNTLWRPKNSMGAKNGKLVLKCLSPYFTSFSINFFLVKHNWASLLLPALNACCAFTCSCGTFSCSFRI